MDLPIIYKGFSSVHKRQIRSFKMSNARLIKRFHSNLISKFHYNTIAEHKFMLKEVKSDEKVKLKYIPFQRLSQFVLDRAEHKYLIYLYYLFYK